MTRARESFSAVSEAPARARKLVESLEELSESERHQIKLLVSELVTNSLRHAGLSDGDRIELEIDVGPKVILVHVGDPGHGFDPTGVRDGEGWGLRLLDRVARSWGTRRNKLHQVWFELARPS